MDDVQTTTPASAAGRRPLWNRARLLLRSALASNVVGGLALLGALGLIVATGIVGIGRGSDSGMDMAYFYGAGRCWIRGLNAYDPPTLQQNAGAFLDGKFFFYPPQIGPLALLLGLFSFPSARVLMWVINLGSAAVLAWLGVRAVRQESGPRTAEPAPEPRWIVPAIVLGVPFTSHIIFMGQSSLLAAAALYGGWTLAGSGRWLAGGALIGIATLKPQLAFLPVLWLLLERQWKTLAAGGATALIAALPAILVSGPIGAYRDWLGTLSRVSECLDSVPGADHLFSLHNVFASAGILLPSFIPLAVVATILLWWFRSRLAGGDVLPLLLCTTMLFGFSGDYDLIVLVPLIPAFWRHLRGRDEAAVGAALLMLTLFIPQRAMAITGLPLLLHFRVLVLLILSIWLARLSLQGKPKPLEAAGPLGPAQAPPSI